MIPSPFPIPIDELGSQLYLSIDLRDPVAGDE